MLLAAEAWTTRLGTFAMGGRSNPGLGLAEDVFVSRPDATGFEARMADDSSTGAEEDWVICAGEPAACVKACCAGGCSVGRADPGEGGEPLGTLGWVMAGVCAAGSYTSRKLIWLPDLVFAAVMVLAGRINALEG